MTQKTPMAIFAASLAYIAACSDEPTAATSPLGTFTLRSVSGVTMPALVKDRLVQAWIMYVDGSLILRADSTYNMEIESRFRDFPNAVIDGRHIGPFRWNDETGQIDLKKQDGESAYRGTAGVDTVRLYCWSGCSVPFPDQPPDFTFVRARE